MHNHENTVITFNAVEIHQQQQQQRRHFTRMALTGSLTPVSHHSHQFLSFSLLHFATVAQNRSIFSIRDICTVSPSTDIPGFRQTITTSSSESI